MKPIIGIVTCGFEKQRQFVSQPYIRAIERSGGIPLLLPCCQSRDILKEYTRICHGFLFCGGGDITPILFGEPPLTEKGSADMKTDIFQLSLMEYALKSRLPVLAICRGMQVLNIALGGTIYQDLSLSPSPAYQHMQISPNRSDVSHQVFLTPGSKLHAICGDSLYTNSYHHQTVHEVGDGLRISAASGDQSIEALESEHLPFAIGVQWHPECMYDVSPEMRSLFAAFLKSAVKVKP